MRKHLFWVLGLVVVLASVGVASAIPNTQSIVGKIAPKKLPKTGKKAAVSLDVNVFSTHPPGETLGDLPHPTKNAKVDFDKDIFFQQKGFDTCDPTQFGSSTTTGDVKQACPDAIIGNGSATVAVPTATGVSTIPADVIAANVAGDKVMLHSYNSTTAGTTLVGQLTKTSGKYGTTLDVDVPPLGGGAGVITQFQTKIDKVVYRQNGKKRAIVASSCKNKKLDFRARFTDDRGQLAVGTSTQVCKQKPAKKKGNN